MVSMSAVGKNPFAVYRKRLVAVCAALALSLGLAIMPAAGAITIGGPSDCDDNAIIRCGAHSTAALINSYNSSPYVQNVYAFFGISAADMSNLPANDVAGRVTRDGRVFVDGQSQAVATRAITGGRQDIGGSNKVTYHGSTFFVRPPSVSFQQDSLPAFVSMKNGNFQFAIIVSCGNAVRAAAVAQPKAAVGPAKAVSNPTQQKPQKPAPQKPAPKPAAPAPTQTQTQTQTQNVTQNNNQQVTVNNTSASQESPAAPVATEAGTTVASSETAPAESGAVSSLPNVGPGGGAGAIFIGSTLLGIFGYRRYLLHILGS